MADGKEQSRGYGDPTANVLALVEAANRRQDDLRVETNRRIDSEITCIKDIANIRAEHLQTLLSVRAAHNTEMSRAETDRLNAIRQVDVLAVSTAATTSLSAIQRLAETTATNADNLRTAMTTTATAVAQQNAAMFGAITERLAALEKSMYEGAGKTGGMQYLITLGLAVGGLAIAIAVYLK